MFFILIMNRTLHLKFVYDSGSGHFFKTDLTSIRNTTDFEECTKADFTFYKNTNTHFQN